MIWGKKIGTFNKNPNNVVIYNGLPTRDEKVKPRIIIKVEHFFIDLHTEEKLVCLGRGLQVNLDLEFLSQVIVKVFHSSSKYKLYKDYMKTRYLGKLNFGGIVDLNSEIDIMLCRIL